jgi:hypothetical protein
MDDPKIDPAPEIRDQQADADEKDQQLADREKGMNLRPNALCPAGEHGALTCVLQAFCLQQDRIPACRDPR